MQPLRLAWLLGPVLMQVSGRAAILQPLQRVWMPAELVLRSQWELAWPLLSPFAQRSPTLQKGP